MSKTIQNGGFTNPLGQALTGNLLLILSQDAKVAASPNQVAPISTRIPITAGNIAPTLIYFNDELLPNNTYYTITAYDAAGNKTYGPEQVSFAGAGPLDLGTLVPLLISPDPLFSNPVLQNPTLPQTIAGQGLTLTATAPLTVNGTATLTGNVTATAGQNVVNLYSLNGIRIVDGNKYAQTTAGVQNCINDAGLTGNPCFISSGTAFIAANLAQNIAVPLPDETGLAAASNPVWYVRMPQQLATEYHWLPRAGTVNCTNVANSVCTWVSGDQFLSEWHFETQFIVAGIHATVSSVSNCTGQLCTTITLNSNVGTQTGAAYSVASSPNTFSLRNGGYFVNYVTPPATNNCLGCEDSLPAYRALNLAVQGESNERHVTYLSGRHEFGPGSARDLGFMRVAPGVFELDTNTLVENLEFRMVPSSLGGANYKLISAVGSNGSTIIPMIQLLGNDVLAIGGAGGATITSFRPDGTERMELDGTQHIVEVPLRLTEIAAPAGSAGTETLYGDSTAHWLFLNPNNTGFVKLLAAGSGANNPLQTQSAAGCATAASLNATCTTTITWSNAFADANYKVTGCMGNAITSGVPALQVITAKVAASITVQTISLTAVAAQFTNIECGAVHN